jgi:hypothetical protein
MDTVVIDKTDAITGHFIRESHGHFNETKVGGKLSVEFRVRTYKHPANAKRICSFLRDLITLFRVKNVLSFISDLASGVPRRKCP